MLVLSQCFIIIIIIIIFISIIIITGRERATTSRQGRPTARRVPAATRTPLTATRPLVQVGASTVRPEVKVPQLSIMIIYNRTWSILVQCIRVIWSGDNLT